MVGPLDRWLRETGRIPPQGASIDETGKAISNAIDHSQARVGRAKVAQWILTREHVADYLDAMDLQDEEREAAATELEPGEQSTIVSTDPRVDLHEHGDTVRIFYKRLRWTIKANGDTLMLFSGRAG
jgi:hypothetical protein